MKSFSRNRKEEVLKRLGLKPGDMDGVPLISHILRESEGGIEEVIECLRGSDDEIAQGFIARYNKLAPSDKTRVSIEQVCVAAGIDTPDLLGAATKAIFNAKQATSQLKLASAHPKLVAKSIQMGLQDKGVRDREMMHSAVGFLPKAQGGAVFFKQTIQVAHLENPDNAMTITQPDQPDLPEMETDIIGLNSAAKKLLEGEVIRPVSDSECTPSQ